MKKGWKRMNKANVYCSEVLPPPQIMGQLGKCLKPHMLVIAHLFDGFTVSAELFAAFCKLLKTFSRSLIFLYLLFSFGENLKKRGKNSVGKRWGDRPSRWGSLAQCCRCFGGVGFICLKKRVFPAFQIANKKSIM